MTFSHIQLPSYVNANDQIRQWKSILEKENMNPGELTKHEALAKKILDSLFEKKYIPANFAYLFKNEYSDGKMPVVLNREALAEFDPSKIPLVSRFTFYVLETAIKIGNLNCVKNIFSRYKETMPSYKEELRSGRYCQHPYRPIFWLAGVCDTQKAFIHYPPEEYIKIMEFLEEELEIGLDHLHLTPGQAFTRMEYIDKFAKTPEKREAIKAHYEKKQKQNSSKLPKDKTI